MLSFAASPPSKGRTAVSPHNRSATPAAAAPAGGTLSTTSGPLTFTDTTPMVANPTGEGAGFALVEKTTAQSDDSAVLLLGVGESGDAYHMSTPHPEGRGARLAMQRALDAAGLAPDAIDYINLHGTATKANDASEDHAVCAVFGTSIPGSSTKGSTGHLLGAAGIIEAIISILAIRNNFMPGSVHTKNVDPALKCNYLLANREGRVQRVLSNSFGFGGSNCSLVFGARG